MSDLEQLGVQIRGKRRELDSQAGEARVVLQRRDELNELLRGLATDIVNYERATSLLNSIGEERQFAAQEVIEQLVTRGLQTIFDDTVSFHILQDVKARRAEVSFIVRTQLPNGKAVDTDVMDARGGGMAAIIGFLLRVTVMLLKAEHTREDNFLVLDETFAMVSERYQPALRDFIRQIVDKTGIQILMVTHQPIFAEGADKVYRLTNVDGDSVVKEDS